MRPQKLDTVSMVPVCERGLEKGLLLRQCLFLPERAIENGWNEVDDLVWGFEALGNGIMGFHPLKPQNSEML